MSATASQIEAVESEHRNIMVAAGPGSGKTRTLVERIGRLIEKGCDPSRIAVLTYTNAAANEISNRLGIGERVIAKCLQPVMVGDPAIVGKNIEKPQILKLGFCGTLHSFGLRMLKVFGSCVGYGPGTCVISPESALDLMESKARSMGCKTSVEKLLQLKAENGRPPRGKRLSLQETVIATYLDELRESRVVDYDVLLHELLAILLDRDEACEAAAKEIGAKFDHLLVDEVQDSAPIDWEIYRALRVPNKFFVGDPDQSLYAFRGAAVREMVAESASVLTLTIKLEDNFRCSEAICAAAQTLIEHNSDRIGKRTVSAAPDRMNCLEIKDPFEGEQEEVVWMANQMRILNQEFPFGEMAVLCRTNGIADAMRLSLRGLSLPVSEMTTHRVPPDWKTARAFLEFVADPDNDSLAYLYLTQKAGNDPKAKDLAHAARISANADGKTINQARLGFGKASTPESALAALRSNASRESHALAVEKWNEMAYGASLEEFILSLGSVSDYQKEEACEAIHVLTVHAAKGREFDAVFVPAFEDECFPGQSGKTQEGIEEERRVAYVAMTRARHALFISSSKMRQTKWAGLVKRTPSRFLKEIKP